MASRLVRVNPVTVNDVLDGHVSLDLECLDRLYLNGYLAQAAGGWAGGPVPAAPGVRGVLAGVPAADRRRVPPLGRLLRRRQPHPGGAVEVHRPQHRRDAPLPGFGCATGVRRSPRSGWRRSRSGCSSPASATPTRPGRRSSPSTRRTAGSPSTTSTSGTPTSVRRSSRSAPTARGRSRSGSTGTSGPNVKPRKAGIGFTELSNGFASSRRSGRVAGDLRPARPGHDQVFFQRWLSRLPLPLTAADRAGRLLVGAVDGPDRDLPHHRVRRTPARPRLLRGPGHRQPRPRPPGHHRDHLRPPDPRRPAGAGGAVQDQGGHPRHRGHHQRLLQALPHQAVPERRAGAADRDRASTTPTTWAASAACTTSTSCRPRRVRSTTALLQTERVGQGCVLANPVFERIAHPTVTADGRRAPALRFGDPRVQALAGALCVTVLRRHRHHQQEPARPDDRTARRPLQHDQASYDLARLRRNGLITRARTPTPTTSPPTASASRSSTPRSTTGSCAPCWPPTSPRPPPASRRPCAPSTSTSTTLATARLPASRLKTLLNCQELSDQGSLRSVRDFARKEWPPSGQSG